MPVGLWNLEWLNSNSQRSYPLSEDATKVDQSGTFTIPDSLLLGLYVPVNAGVNVQPESFFVREVTVFGNGVNVSIAYDDGTANPPVVATAAVPFSGHEEYRSYALPGAGDFADTLGKAVFGKLDELLTLPPGRYTFDYAGGKLDSDCVRPQLRGVSSLVLINGSDRSAPITGDVELSAGANVRLSVSTVGAVSTVRIDAVEGEGLTKSCVCAEDEVQAPCIRTINGIAPTPAGDFTLVGDDCLEIQDATNGVKLEDKCSKPCCGCAELEAVTRDLERFGDAALSLNNYLTRLEGAVNRMSLTVLGNRLNDRGCPSS